MNDKTKKVMSCYKAVFSTRAKAQKAAFKLAREKNRHLNPYKCPNCHQFHLTHL